MGKIAVVVLTRNGEGYDSRFPGKGMVSLFGKPLSYWIFDKAAKSGADAFIAALPNTRESKSIGVLCKEMGGTIYAGDPIDTLDRRIRACHVNDVEWIINWSGDCPFILLDCVKELVDGIRAGDADGYNHYGPGVPYDKGTVEGLLTSAQHISWLELQQKQSEEAGLSPSQREQAQVHLDIDKHRKTKEYHNRFYDQTKTPMKLSIDFPLELAIANEVCDYIGHIPESLDEIYQAYRYIHTFRRGERHEGK